MVKNAQTNSIILQIIRERIPNYPERNGLVWNAAPGALLSLPTYSDSMQHMPFLLDVVGQEPRHNYTAVIFVQIGNAVTPNSALYRLVKAITKSQFVDRVSRALSIVFVIIRYWMTLENARNSGI